MHTLDITVYSLNVMKIQYTEQQYNALEIVQYIHNRSYALLRRMTMNWKVVPFLFFFSPPPNNMQICLDLLWPFQNSHVRNPKLIQNFQSHLMCTHTHSEYLSSHVTVRFKLYMLCCRSVLGSLHDSKSCNNKTMFKWQPSDKQKNHLMFFVSDLSSVICGIMTFLAKFNDPLAVWVDSEVNLLLDHQLWIWFLLRPTLRWLEGIWVSLSQVHTVHYATSFKALSFNLSM